MKMKVVERFNCPFCNEAFNYEISELSATLDLFLEEKACLHDIECENCEKAITMKFNLEIECVPFDLDEEYDDEDSTEDED